MMKWRQKRIIQKTLQRFIKGGLLKAAIKLSMGEVTTKDCRKVILKIQEEPTRVTKFSFDFKQIRLHLYILFEKEA